MTIQIASISRFLSYLSTGLVCFFVLFNLTPFLPTALSFSDPRGLTPRNHSIIKNFKYLRELEDLGPRGDEIWNSAVLPKEGGFLWVQTNITDQNIGREGWGITMFHALHCLQMMREVFKLAIPPEYDDLHTHHTQESRRFKAHEHDMDPKHATHCFSYLYQVITCGADGTLEPPQRQFDVDGRQTAWVVNGVGLQHKCRDPGLLWEVVERSEKKALSSVNWGPGDTVWDSFR